MIAKWIKLENNLQGKTLGIIAWFLATWFG